MRGGTRVERCDIDFMGRAGRGERHNLGGAFGTGHLAYFKRDFQRWRWEEI